MDIPYSATTYSIVFKRGENLELKGDTIHRNYNGWIQNPDRAIRAEFTRM